MSQSGNAAGGKSPENHSAMLSLPDELILKITDYVPQKDLKTARLANRKLGRIGMESVKNLVVKDPAELREALEAYKYKPGGVQSLRLDGPFTDDDLRDLPDTIEHLEIANCTQLTAAALKNLPSSVRRLNVSWCSGLTGAALQNLSHLSLLTHLVATGCDALTNDSLRKLPASLVELNLRGCVGLTVAGLRNLLSLPVLAHLDISGCIKMTHAVRQDEHGHDVREFFVYLPDSLTHLNVSECFQLGDDALRDISVLSLLIHLDLRECNRVTDAVLPAIGELPLLTHLDVRDCDKLTKAALQNLRDGIAVVR